MRNNDIEELFPSWFEGTLSQEEREKVEQWKEASEENRQLFADSLRAWEGIEQLRLMKKYNPEKAIQQVNAKIQKEKRINIFDIFQKIAAVLILPLLIATIWFAIDKPKETSNTPAVWHTLEIPAGMRSEFYLPDSTKVYLNSRTRLSYPLEFSGNIREIKLSGEAYFEVAENKKVPFIVNTGGVNIEVTGTEFIVTRYPYEELTEIILIEGIINLYRGDYSNNKRDILQLKPGEKALWQDIDKKMAIANVDTYKYKAWKEGLLVFREDQMTDVVRRLNRWFNVDIQLEGPQLQNWAYTATFENESLEQVLELLKISAPIEYTIKRREMKTDKTFSKMEIVIKQK